VINNLRCAQVSAYMPINNGALKVTPDIGFDSKILLGVEL
jgi:hypothetical protein